MSNPQFEARSETQKTFWDFYREVFLPEHTHPLTIGLHVVGTLLGTAFAAWAAFSPWPLIAILYPLVHAFPGLLAHRLVERSSSVGDVRVTRRDFPLFWFILGNHVLTVQVFARLVGARIGPQRGG
jgi:hypothetical protein